jgi:hypothetical protein
MHALILAAVLSAESPPPLTSANPTLEPLPYPGNAASTPAAEPEGQPIPNSFSVYVSFLEPSFAVFAATGTGGSPVVSSTSASATFRLGGVFGGRHAVLFGLSFAAFGGLGVGSSGYVGITLAPAYRIHFKPLVPGGFSPFLQLEGILGTIIISGPGIPLVLAFGPGFGAEHLFSKHFGIAAAVGGRLTYTTYASLALAGVSLWASVAVALHF